MGEPIKPVVWQRRHGCNTPWIVANAEYVAFYRSVGQEIRQLYDIDPNEAASRIAELDAKLATAVGALERVRDADPHHVSRQIAEEALASIQERT